MRRGLKPSVRGVLGLSGEVHLGDQAVGAKFDKKMDMRRP